MGRSGTTSQTVTCWPVSSSACQRALFGRAQLTAVIASSGGRWTPHDLPHIDATLIKSFGVLPETTEKYLNHTEQDQVKLTYQRHSHYQPIYSAFNFL